MNMSAGAPPEGPSAGPLDLTPEEIAQRRADLQAQLAQLPPQDNPVEQPQQQQQQPEQPQQQQQQQQPVYARNMLVDPQSAQSAAGVSAGGGMTYQGQPLVSPFTGGNVQDAPVSVGDPQAPVDPNTDDSAPFSHWLHLADGKVIKALGTFTTWHADDDPRTPGIPVVASVANPAYVMGHGDVNSRRKSLIAELKALGFDLTDLFRA